MQFLLSKSGRCLFFIFCLVLISSINLPLHASADSTSSSDKMSRRERIDAKRRFDRVKQHPTEGGGTPMPSSSEDTIEYQASDGSIRQMSRKELQDKLEQQSQILPQIGEDGVLRRSQEGQVSSVEELREKDPFLGSVVDAAKLALRTLQEQGFVVSQAHLKSLSSIDQKDNKKEQYDSSDRFHLLLTIVEGNKNEFQKERFFEVLVGKDHLHEAWESDKSLQKKTAIKLSHEGILKPSWFANVKQRLHFVEEMIKTKISLGSIILLIGVFMSLTGLILSWTTGVGGKKHE